MHLALYLALPYLLLQQSVYAFWLLGGGSVIAAVFLGLVLAGLVLGPNVYCATLCPTGAALSLLGRARMAHMGIVEPDRCGSHCDLCDVGCWLQLEPASGDAGSDCDLCARCVEVCPRTNLGIRFERPFRKTTGVLFLCALSSLPALFDAREALAAAPRKPTLVLEEEVHVRDVVVALSLLDLSDVELSLDWETARQGTELRVYLARGDLDAPDANGHIPLRESYAGPLLIEIERWSGGESRIAFEQPNHPISTQRPSIYRRALPLRFSKGDRVTLLTIPGWLEVPVSFEVAEQGTRQPLVALVRWSAAALLIYLGSMALALGGVRQP